jgi:hypothetical protein
MWIFLVSISTFFKSFVSGFFSIGILGLNKKIKNFIGYLGYLKLFRKQKPYFEMMILKSYQTRGRHSDGSCPIVVHVCQAISQLLDLKS